MSEEPRGVWLTRVEISALAEALRDRGYHVLTDHLLDPLVDGVYAGRFAVRVCAVAPDLPLAELFELVEKVLGVRRSA